MLNRTLIVFCSLAFQIMLIACSSFVREMLPKELNCECEIFSIFLPDYKPRTIKNLLSILYTGELTFLS